VGEQGAPRARGGDLVRPRPLRGVPLTSDGARPTLRP
jgi:hypothetical protein